MVASRTFSVSKKIGLRGVYFVTVTNIADKYVFVAIADVIFAATATATIDSK